MTSKKSSLRISKPVGAAVGAGAIMVLGVLGVSGAAGLGIGTASAIPDAPAGLSHYVQPHVHGMTIGETATFQAPASTPSVAMAVPPVKAGS